jgi:hypothetical protein
MVAIIEDRFEEEEVNTPNDADDGMRSREERSAMKRVKEAKDWWNRLCGAFWLAAIPFGTLVLGAVS